jgi:hypothetical protein
LMGLLLTVQNHRYRPELLSRQRPTVGRFN